MRTTTFGLLACDLPFSGVVASTYDIFLVLHPFRDNVREFQVITEPLADLTARHVHSVEGYYATRIDTALIALRFSHLLVERWGADTVHRFAGRTGLPLVVPPQLSPPRRRGFFLRHLSRYSTYVQNYPHLESSQPLVRGIIASLGEHLDSEPRELSPRDFDAARDLPLFDGRRRLSSVWG